MEKNLDKGSAANNNVCKWGCMLPSHVVWRVGALKELAEKFLGKRLAALGYEGLFPSHGGIIAMLFTAGGKLQMKEIVDRLERTKSTVSELVNKLEHLGLVKRCECTVDGRVCYVSLTEKGWAFEKDLSAVAAELNAAMYKGFSGRERAEVEALIMRMKDNLAE
jgi:DNA-binding MarR family transcriptional regulator